MKKQATGFGYSPSQRARRAGPGASQDATEFEYRSHPPRGWKWKVWALLVIAAAGGCARYHPAPLTEEAVRDRLQPPDMGQTRILAAEIKHPILRPVELRPDEGLTPEGAAVIAVLLNPSLRAIRDQKAVSGAQLLEAGLLPNPELGYSLEAPTGGDTAGKATAYGLGLDWEATSLLARSARVDEARSREKAVDLDVAWREWQTAQGAKSAVYQLFSLQGRIVLADEIRRRAAESQARIQKAVAEGSMTAGDLAGANAATVRASEKLIDLRKQAEQARLRLGRLLGLPAGARIRLSKDIRLPARIAAPDEQGLFDQLEHRRLDLLALRRGYDSQEAAVRAAILEQFPKISVGPTISRDTDSVRTSGFAARIELPILDRRQGKIAYERATRQMLFDEYVNRVFEARSDIEEILAGIRCLNEQIAVAQKAATDLGSLAEARGAALADGRTSALVYCAAQNDAEEARAKALVFQGQLAQAVVALELATGFYELPPPAPSAKPGPAESDEEIRP